MEIVDTHVHLYAEDEARYPMKESPLRPPPRTGTLAHLRQVTSRAGVTKVVAVQAGTAYLYDNRFLAETVKANRDWMTGICLLDPGNAGSSLELTRLVKNYGLRGIRVGFPNTRQLEGLLGIWETARRLGVVVCAHFKGDYFETLARFLERFPEVPVVLDHCAYMSASEAPGLPTLKALLKLRRPRNLYLKLSFVVMGSLKPYPCPDTMALAKRLIEGFGAERCMWGGCFPTELWIPRVTYEQHLRIFTEEMGLDPGARKAILETTPISLWFTP